MRPLPWKSTLSVFCVAALLACRPDPYSLLLRTIEPGEAVDLPDGMTLVAEEREGAVLRGVTVTGPARTCEGTMELVAPEVRVERGSDGAGVRLVLERPVATERCGEATARTRHDRLTVLLEGSED